MVGGTHTATFPFVATFNDMPGLIDHHELLLSSRLFGYDGISEGSV